MSGELKVMWDLFSGLGGASQAFIEDPDWLVIRFENNPDLQHVAHTQDRDILDWREWVKYYPKPDFIWASPPCLEFSRAFNAPAPKAQREGIEFNPDMSLVLAALDIIEELDPTNWCIENVQGAQKEFSFIPALGSVMKYKPFFLWGNIPPLILPAGFRHLKSEQDKRWSPIRSNHKAKIPLEFSHSIKDAIENQMTLWEWL